MSCLENDRWEEDVIERYEEYLQEYCTTHGPDDDEYMSYEAFRDAEAEQAWEDLCEG